MHPPDCRDKNINHRLTRGRQVGAEVSEFIQMRLSKKLHRPKWTADIAGNASTNRKYRQVKNNPENTHLPVSISTCLSGNSAQAIRQRMEQAARK
jgi:hypothetical protein